MVKIIDEYRKENGEPPATMSALWDFSHKITMEEAGDVKILQEHYKKTVMPTRDSLGYPFYIYKGRGNTCPY